jgi:hypothetical protein
MICLGFIDLIQLKAPDRNIHQRRIWILPGEVVCFYRRWDRQCAAISEGLDEIDCKIRPVPFNAHQDSVRRYGATNRNDERSHLVRNVLHLRGVRFNDRVAVCLGLITKANGKELCAFAKAIEA